jgi:hypothetical protein
MASSSSAKKVARVAARSSTNSKNKGANWLFPVIIVAIIAAGIGVLAYARSENLGTGNNDTPPRAQLSEGSAYDHWHAAFAVNVCGKELGPFADVGADVLGIHAHAGEALIHIHPFSIRAAGENARMQVFFDQVGLVVTDDGFKTPDGDVYKEGETTCGGEPTELVMAHWKQPMTSPEAPDAIIRSGFGDVAFTADLEAYSLALLPKGEVPALPAGVASLVNPSDTAGAGGDTSIPDLSIPETVPGDPAATTPVDPATESTTAPADPATEATAPETTAGSGG